MFGYFILGYGVVSFCSTLGMIIADKIRDYKRKKRFEQIPNEPVAIKVSIVDGVKTTTGYISNDEDFQKLIQKHLTNEIL